MALKSIPKRLNRIRTFAAASSSITALPGLLIAAVACDNAFGHAGWWSATLGKIFATVKVRTKAIEPEYALIDTHDLGQLVSCEELLVQGIYDFSLVPFVPDVIVDCGSHIGLFSLIAALKYPNAVLTAYEPEPRNLKVLRQQLARFNSRITVVEAAVSAKDGHSSFCVFQSNCGRLDDPDRHVPVANEKWFTVRTIDLDAEADRWQAKNLLIKIDIEGAEGEVMPMLVTRLPLSTALFLEIHGEEALRERLRQLLVNAGFEVSITRWSAESSDWFGLRTT
jgi:FkbM family methyltransferase